MSFPDLTRAKRAIGRVLVHGAAKRPGQDESDAWLRRHPLHDLAAVVRHVGRCMVDPAARDEESGELHATHAAARLLLVVERLERRK